MITSTINGGQQYYLYNAHGDVTGLTNGSGIVTKSYRYDAFGNEKNPADADVNPFRYCGEYFDKETGSIYLRARYYVPGLGRFTTQDPIRDGLNWYTYCGGNPITYADPLGLREYTQYELELMKRRGMAQSAAAAQNGTATEATKSQLNKFAAFGRFDAMTKAAETFFATGALNISGQKDSPLKTQPAIYGQPRSAQSYRDTLDAFNVETSPRYKADSFNTYCNIFMWDVSRSTGAEIPHWYNENGDPVPYAGYDEMIAAGRLMKNANNMILLWLDSEKGGWYEITEANAITRANAGYPTVAVFYNPDGIGHVAMVSPQRSGDIGVMIAQAGAANYNYAPLASGFGDNPVTYYTHN